MSEHTETWRERYKKFKQETATFSSDEHDEDNVIWDELAFIDELDAFITAELSRRDAEWEAGVRGVAWYSCEPHGEGEQIHVNRDEFLALLDKTRKV